MRLMRAIQHWARAESPSAANPAATPTTPTQALDTLSNVVQLTPGTPLDAPAGLQESPQASPHESAPTVSPLPRGLLEAPELQGFFAQNHFGLGRHNGAQYKTQDALAMGRQHLAAQFQNVLETLIAQRQAKADALRHMALQTQGVCPTVTGQLQLAGQRLERDMATLQTQIDLAAQGKGWVLTALNQYQIGFGKGLREAIDMELLG